MVFLLIFIFELTFLYFLSNLLQKSLSRAIFSIVKSATATVNVLLILFLPGVIIHELSHFLVASLLFVKTGEIKFLPEITEEGTRLGSVGIGKTDPIRRAIIGFAPVLLGLIVLLGLTYYLTQGSASISIIKLSGVYGIFFYLILIYLLFAVGNTMFSSKKDLEGTIELFIVLGIIFFASYVAGIRMQATWIQTLLRNEIIDFIKRVDLFFIIPIGIDIFIYLLAVAFIKRR
ncbi:MAG: hypothetical protein M1372_02110 [Patescibacteria group bacterium]|nr:hypothetical protein [Patescibacteria group bacterium]